MNVRDENRDAQMVVMRASGETLDTIGAAFGVSRERARQVLARNGGTGSRPAAIDPLAVMRLIRRRETVSLATVAVALGVELSAVCRLLRALDRYGSVSRLLRWRRDIIQRASILAQLRAFVTAHGRSPYMREFGVAVGTKRHPDLPAGSSVQRHFGTITAAFDRAGIARRREWQRGGGERHTHCKRGHPFTPDNVYAWTQSGKLVRQCRICTRARKRAAYHAQKRAILQQRGSANA